MDDSPSTALFLTKYKPMQLANFEMDQENKTVLKILLELDRISLLFTGSIGCGKTTLIEIILREYYNLPPTGGITRHRDILYVTNLKEQGIGYFRGEFKMFCQTYPEMPTKRKIVVIDDIDSVNFQCQQLLRNCMDKYPKVHFIAGCTNMNNVIDALQSRFTVMSLPMLTNARLMRMATKISKAENIQIELKAKKEMIAICNHQPKKLITYLEKIKLMETPIGTHNINTVYATAITGSFNEYLKKIHNLPQCIKILYDLYDSGYSVTDIFDNFFIFIKANAALSDDDKYSIITLVAKHMARIHTVHDDPLELALFTNRLRNIFL